MTSPSITFTYDWQLSNDTWDSQLNVTPSPGVPTASFGEDSVIFQVQVVVVPFLILFGVVGNGLSLWVFCTPAFRGHSSSSYLAALAASDSLFLFTLSVVWASNAAALDLYNAHGWCQGVTYLTHVTTFVSVWLVVAFTVERFIAVCYPLLRSAVCTVRRARGVVIALASFALTLYAYLLFAAGVEPTPPDKALRCTLRPGWESLASAMNGVDTLLTLVLPVVAVITLNSRIARTVLYVDRLHQQGNDLFASDRHLHFSGAETNWHSRGLTRRSSQHNVTKMLLVISTIFILLNLPSYVIRLYIYFTAMTVKDTDQPSATLYNLQQIFTLLFYANFAINFMLYCVTGQNFRRAVVDLCKGRDSTGPRAHLHLATSPQGVQGERPITSPDSTDFAAYGRFNQFSNTSHKTSVSVIMRDYCETTIEGVPYHSKQPRNATFSSLGGTNAREGESTTSRTEQDHKVGSLD